MPWACSICTFENTSDAANACDMCTTVRPMETSWRRGSPLKNAMLSPATCLDSNPTEQHVPELSRKQINHLLKQHVATLPSLVARDGSTPVARFIHSSYHSGLPLFESNPAVQAQLILAIRFVLAKVHAGMSASLAREVMTRLAEAFTACQAVQCRVIDSLYGDLSGRDGNLKDQLLTVLDALKEQTLEQVAHFLNPNAWRQGDEHPQAQLPHILSSYRVRWGHHFGLRGVKASQCDNSAPTLSGDHALEVRNLFYERFDEKELINECLLDVNQPGDTAERRISRESLAKWAGSQSVAGGFDPHSIYWDEERSDEFSGRPAVGEEFEPFLSLTVAREMVGVLLMPGEKPTTRKRERDE